MYIGICLADDMVETRVDVEVNADVSSRVNIVSLINFEPCVGVQLGGARITMENRRNVCSGLDDDIDEKCRMPLKSTWIQLLQLRGPLQPLISVTYDICHRQETQPNYGSNRQALEPTRRHMRHEYVTPVPGDVAETEKSSSYDNK